MPNETLDDDLMRRFLVGTVTPDEREQVERLFMTDRAFFEALTALDDEILLLYARGELPDAERDQVGARVANSPARKRRLDELTAFAAAVSNGSAGGETTVDYPKPARRPWRRVVWLATAAVVVVASMVAWGIVRRTGKAGAGDVSGDSQPVPTRSATTLAQFLQPSSTRTTAEPQLNIFRIQPEVETIALTFRVPVERLTNPRISLALVSGASIGTDFGPRIQAGSAGVDVSVDVPARLIPAGDYLLTLTADMAGRAQEPIASRFFSVVR